VRVLRDQDWWVRVRAADALGALGGKTVVDSMITLLQDPDEAIRRHAVEILNMVPDERAIDALVAALDDPDWWVRERAIDTLGKTGDRRAVEPLLRLLAADDTVVALCARALSAIGDPQAIMPLCLWAESDREDARQDVLEALKSFLRKPISAEEKAHIQTALGRFSAPRPGARGAISPSHDAAPRSAGALPPSGYTARLPVRPMAPPPVVRRAVEEKKPVHATNGPSENPQLGVADVHRLEPGTVLLDRYRVIRKVGRGGYGAVYLVEDAAIQDQVILKILNPQLSFDENARYRFVRELKLTRRITHRNIIRLHDILDLGGVYAVSMEFFPGEDLGQILEREVRINWERGLMMMAQVCDGLAAAHEIGVVHRDLKPANLLIGDDDFVKILDFGLATPIQNPESRLTKSGLLIGTPEYMAPEQIAGEQVDARVDIYAVGIIFYEMFSGMKPYVDETPVKVLFRHLEGDAAPLSEVAPELPAALANLVARTMARDPDQRPATVQELRQEIDARLAALQERS
jgi:serine/threonine-protein kinase